MASNNFMDNGLDENTFLDISLEFQVEVYSFDPKYMAKKIRREHEVAASHGAAGAEKAGNLGKQ